MQTVTLKDAPEIARLVKAAAPDYRKRQAFIFISDDVSLSNTYWDGGSRSTYTAVNLETLRASTAEQFAPPQFGGPRVAPKVKIPDGACIVETGTFCGKPATASVYLNASAVRHLLPSMSL